MSPRDRSLAVIVAVLWGLNFAAVRLGLEDFPPVFFAAMRYLVLAIPVLLFVPRPQVAWRWLIVYGLGFGVVQFGLLFLAIDQGMPSGLASVIVQASAPMTVLLAVPLLGERPGARQLGGIAVACAGILAISLDRGDAGIGTLVLTLFAALGWAVGNLAVRKAASPQPLRLAVWMSVVPPLPLLALSAITEGPTAGWRAVGHAATSADGWGSLLALVYVTIGGSVVGAALWSSLLARHPVALVAPYSLLVPVVAILGGLAFFGEQPTVVELAGSAVVVAGILISMRKPAAAVRPTAAAPVAATAVEGGELARPQRRD